MPFTAAETSPAPFAFINPLTVPAPPRAAAKVPPEMLLALVVSVVAEGAKATPLVLVHPPRAIRLSRLPFLHQPYGSVEAYAR